MNADLFIDLRHDVVILTSFQSVYCPKKPIKMSLFWTHTGSQIKDEYLITKNTNNRVVMQGFLREHTIKELLIQLYDHFSLCYTGMCSIISTHINK